MGQSENGQDSSGFFSKLFNRGGQKDAAEEIQDLIDEREEDAPLTKNEKDLISAALQFSTVEADDIAVPRSEIVALHIDDGFEKCLELFQKTRHSRLLVFGKDMDDILGFLTFKDVMLAVGDNQEEFKLSEVVRAVPFVPDTMPVPRVLQLLKKHRVQMAVVVDEYGGTAGIITLKDVLEELVGDIDDEHALTRMHLMPLKNGRYKVDPRMPIAELEAHLNTSLTTAEEEVEFETVSGWVLHLAGHFPNVGEQFELPSGHFIIVTEADERRIIGLELVHGKTA